MYQVMEGISRVRRWRRVVETHNEERRLDGMQRQAIDMG